jgi:hypothetical protein
MTEDEIRELFREMREEAVPADSLARVRLRLGDRMRRRARWKLVAWGMAGTAVLMAAILVHQETAVRKPASVPIVARQPDPQPMERPQAAPRLNVRPAIRTMHRRTEHTSQPVVIRIETPDPDVVILLVGE